ncbi:MAG: aminoacyl-tRNA hydrolase [Candidatus Omnitrophica bacterium]|nr:aminoacyl-tRNA hydrolase [Candidatus Omnitrophota bacterium]
MILIAGLGNPGKVYLNSRHNIGFSAVEALSKIYKIPLKRDRGTFSLSGRGKIDNKNVILAMPQTFMNLSGIALQQLLKKYKIDLTNLLIVCDDLDLEFGRLKIKPSGSTGGHRGLKSIIDAIGKDKFARLRVGIGRPVYDTEEADYVLSAFSRGEQGGLKKILQRVVLCCRSWVNEGISETMNIYNVRTRKGVLKDESR